MLPENYQNSSINCKVVGYKINTQKSLAYLYTSSERSERKIKETSSCAITTKRIKS